jgi:hypothetical protein
MFSVADARDFYFIHLEKSKYSLQRSTFVLKALQDFVKTATNNDGRLNGNRHLPLPFSSKLFEHPSYNVRHGHSSVVITRFL